MLVPKVHLAQLERRAREVLVVSLAFRVFLVTLVNVDPLEAVVSLALRVLLVPRVVLVNVATLALLVPKVPLVNLDDLVSLVCLAQGV